MDFQIEKVESITGTASDPKSGWSEWFDITNLVNIIIDFINKLIKFEF